MMRVTLRERERERLIKFETVGNMRTHRSSVPSMVKEKLDSISSIFIFRLNFGRMNECLE